jgi:hypothetical protein
VTLIIIVTGVLIFPALSVAWAVIVWPVSLLKLIVIDQLPPDKVAILKDPELTLT